MIGDSKICAREGCDENFVARTANQKFHDDECTKMATRQTLMIKYYRRKAIKEGKKRICIQCEDTILSAYNESDICVTCTRAGEEQRNQRFNSFMTSMLESCI